MEKEGIVREIDRGNFIRNFTGIYYESFTCEPPFRFVKSIMLSCKNDSLFHHCTEEILIKTIVLHININGK